MKRKLNIFAVILFLHPLTLVWQALMKITQVTHSQQIASLFTMNYFIVNVGE